MIRRIYELSSFFRSAIEDAVIDRNLTVTPFLSYPRGCCDMGSELLAQYLFENNIETEMINGTSKMDNSHHVWLCTKDEITIDITADQFNGQEGMPSNIEPIIVGNEAPIHKIFSYERIIEKPICLMHPIYQDVDWTNVRECKLCEAYHILLDKYL